MAKKGASCKRTMDLYRKYYPVVWKMEYWCGFSRKRKDFLGFIDVLALNGDETVGIQDTTWGQVSVRKKKILASPLAWEWLQSPQRTIEIIGWKAPDKEQGRYRWEYKTIPITLKDFTNGKPQPDESK